ncbi:TPR-like protein [Mollisia scopiformis]|uniref:TPR-like protein n=1 Tax=Mollisia scopiformis TaxID=149040 RepID=A0A132B1S8_MOLSC|nr:TPR-like protein [Mollisia scopiformis]KUJ06335.1 TPR-like protein [Mollisia scopiformis]
MPLLNTIQKKISWKYKRIEKATKGDSSVPNVRPGLIQVVEPGNGPNVDIVYVHGLSGGRNASQVQDAFSTSELSHRNPNARILSWSYDTRAYSSGYRVEDALESHTNCLLEELATVRSEADIGKRPIVFIAHSLGGMLVKKALLKSCEAGIEEPGMNTISIGIKQSTLGAVLLSPTHSEHSLKPANLGIVGEKLYKLQNEEFQGLCKDVFVQIVHCDPPTPPPTTTRSPGRRPSNRFSIKRTRTSSSSETDSSSSQKSAEFPRDVLETVSSLCTTSSLENRHSAIQREDEKAQSPTSDTFRDNFNIGVVPKSTTRHSNTFVGRQEKLSELFDKISQEEPDQRIVVLHGPQGCGKTRLALECCRRNDTSFSTIFWINASSVHSIQSSYAVFAKALVDHYATQMGTSDSLDSVYRHLGLSDLIDDKTREDGFEQIAGTPLIDAINMWFSQVCNNKWLMVLDNIDESDVTILADFFPTPVSGHILIVTRLEGYVEKHGYQDVLLDNMTKGEGKLLLLSLLTPKLIRDSDPDEGLFLPSQPIYPVKLTLWLDDSALERVVDGCNHLPMSISQAATFINTLSLTLPTYLHVTETSGNKWPPELWNGYNDTHVDEILTANEHVSKKQWKGLHEPTVLTYADWEHQFQDLESSNPAALDLLTLCSFYAKDDVPVSLLRQVITTYDPEEASDRQLEHTLKDLAHRSLITRQSCTTPRKSEDDAMSWISGRDSPELLFPMMETSSAEFNLNVLHQRVNINETTNCISIHPLVHHWAQKRLPNPVAQGLMAERAFQALALAIQSSKRPPSDLIGLESFLPHLQECLEHLDMVNGDPKIDVKWSVLADVCRYQGFHQYARKFYKFSLKSVEAETERPSSQIEAARLRMKLGFVYIQQKRLDKAEKQYKKATDHIVAATRTTKAPGDCNKIANLELKISASLASLYKIQNRFEEAEERYYSILPRFEEVWGSEDIRTLLLLEQFASCLLADGNYEEAEALYRRVLVSYVNEFGLDYPAVAKIQQKLAKALQLQGRYERAEGFLQQALNTTEKRLGNEHPETTKLLLFSAQMKCFLRKFEAAEKIYESVLALQRKVTGTSNPVLLELRVNLGMTYQTQKKYPQAEAMYQKALDDLRAQKDKNSQHEKELMLKLRALYDESKQANSEKAKRLEDQFLEQFPEDDISQSIALQRKRQGPM